MGSSFAVCTWPFNGHLMLLLALGLSGVSGLNDDSLLVLLSALSESCSDVLLLLLSVALC